MLKKLASSLALATLLFSATTQALPIVQADAFAAGDNQAALETSTGLVWMDFGVNSHLSYGQVLHFLPTQFSGWRLPTAAEVDHLWSALFGSLPEWHRTSQEFGYMSTKTQDAYFDAVFAVFGNSNDSSWETRDEDGNQVDFWTNKSISGVFMKAPGVAGFVSAESPYDDIHDSTALYLETPVVSVSHWFGTLLVKDGPTSVPEPGSIALLLIAGAALVARKRRRI